MVRHFTMREIPVRSHEVVWHKHQLTLSACTTAYATQQEVSLAPLLVELEQMSVVPFVVRHT